MPLGKQNWRGEVFCIWGESGCSANLFSGIAPHHCFPDTGISENTDCFYYNRLISPTHLLVFNLNKLRTLFLDHADAFFWWNKGKGYPRCRWAKKWAEVHSQPGSALVQTYWPTPNPSLQTSPSPQFRSTCPGRPDCMACCSHQSRRDQHREAHQQ